MYSNKIMNIFEIFFFFNEVNVKIPIPSVLKLLLMKQFHVIMWLMYAVQLVKCVVSFNYFLFQIKETNRLSVCLYIFNKNTLNFFWTRFQCVFAFDFFLFCIGGSDSETSRLSCKKRWSGGEAPDARYKFQPYNPL